MASRARPLARLVLIDSTDRAILRAPSPMTRSLRPQLPTTTAGISAARTPADLGFWVRFAALPVLTYPTYAPLRFSRNFARNRAGRPGFLEVSGSSTTRRAYTLPPGLAWALIGLGLAGCLVQERCYTDSDCSAPRVCTAQGECKFECSQDADCDVGFGTRYVCTEHRCTMPVACTLCTFEHAEALCVHGHCSMGACDSGYIDLNGTSEDGCEYVCTPSTNSLEVCNGRDDDCDGKVDEDTDLSSSPDHCGTCGHVCPTGPHADAVCTSGKCRLLCHDGWHDNNGSSEDGCEAATCVPSEETCDGHDNDCDCPGDTNGDTTVCGPGDEGVDEGFDKTQPASCGPFCVACNYSHAEALCVDGQCRPGACDEGWHDFDGLTHNGCETQCTPTNDSVERCDGIDNDCDGEIDEGAGCGTLCPDDMVSVGAVFCIDRYEASRPDATMSSPGLDESLAMSRDGVLPWMVNPMTPEHLETFRAACTAAGKRLCSADEWTAACAGPTESPYVYGTQFDREACNCVDTFCDDYCNEQGIVPDACSTAANCGYTYDCYHEVPTGSFAGCTNEYGSFDINGNAWEIVESAADARGYEVRGGAFNCASAAERVSCSFNADWSALYAGFRCCRGIL
jgi:hypothetical protein